MSAKELEQIDAKECEQRCIEPRRDDLGHPTPAGQGEHRSEASAATVQYMPTTADMPSSIGDCPICLSTMTDPIVTQCGHFFCQYCIFQHFKYAKTCPCCSQYLFKDIITPMVAVRKSLTKVQGMGESDEDGTKTRSQCLQEGKAEMLREPNPGDGLLEPLGSNAAMKKVQQSAQISPSDEDEKQKEEEHVNYGVLAQFLTKLKGEKEMAMMQLLSEIAMIEDDIRLTEDSLEALDDSVDHNEDRQVEASTEEKVTSLATDVPVQDKVMSFARKRPHGENDDNDLPHRSSKIALRRQYTTGIVCGADENVKPLGRSQSTPISLLRRSHSIKEKERRILPHFQEFGQTYIARRLACRQPSAYLKKIASTIGDFTRHAQLVLMHTIPCYHISNESNLISSLKFDKDGEFFAVGGVNRKIKLYDYSSLDICLDYSPCYKSQLASVDYEGLVRIWDTEAGRSILALDEHERRTWSVHYNAIQPRQLITASEDHRVKIWSTNSRHSIHTIDIHAIASSATFSPYKEKQVAVGGADHHIHLYDIRMTKRPSALLVGHNQSVSLVQWQSSQELLSASIDGSLKLWDVNQGVCTRTFSGHVNNKFFVGLANKGDWIACGSEDNTTYIYHKDISAPILHRDFGVIMHDDSPEDAKQLFVSALDWRPHSNALVAANSQGHIHAYHLY
ncbi:hypothetical protein BZG36_01970 [Bifiguratus adelaidae]|uniref:RING-type domain-containing protein n=1 Tax=Bifiguratus adelaidae TaxID=1938954 RepID=A0A261Y3S7_9FUNG|nr:hypothetical protein BZG36_01970 [Bifiguratus adelaidae]